MRISHSGNRSVVITAGDPAGVGPEIILRALKKPSLFKSTIPLVIGDYGIFRKTAKTLKLSMPSGLNFMDLKNVSRKSFRFGVSKSAFGRASMEYLACGTSIAKSQKKAALVTAPINKASINRAGFRFSGHTEFLRRFAESKEVTMMLVGGGLRVSLATRHIALADIPKRLSQKIIIRTTEHTYRALKKLFGIKRPRIGIAALNPHAGEEGLLGDEEKRVILPAAKELKRRMKGVAGPFPADTLFYKAHKGMLDAVVCMYHDQGLIPLKMLAFERGVNLTIGLPFIRTSPDHGTAFDIAGKGKANPSSMIEAIKLAVKLLN